MGWMSGLLLGDLGAQMDIGVMRGQLNRHEDAKARRDRNQDRRLDRLEKENRELKLRIAVLIRLLVTKGTFSSEEIADMVRAVEREEPGQTVVAKGASEQVGKRGLR